MALSTALTEIRVVLVEPSTAQASFVDKMLGKIGVLTVEHCQSAADALRALEDDSRPTVVVSSLYLPDMPGTELVAEMRNRPAFEAIPFILISSETRPQVLEPVRQSGACSIVAKPFNDQQLGRAICAAAEYLNPPANLDNDEIERLHVLLVDDSRASRRHLRRLLEELGVERITEAVNGKEAVQHLQDTLVDLVVTDYNMPEMDGHELTAYIRTQSWQAQVPVLMVTSEQHEGRLAAVEKAGVSLICDKPFDAGSIRRLVAEAMNR